MNTKVFVLIVCALELLSLVTACHVCNLANRSPSRLSTAHKRPRCGLKRHQEKLQNIIPSHGYQNKVRYYFTEPSYHQQYQPTSGFSNVQLTGANNGQLLVPISSYSQGIGHRTVSVGNEGYVSGQSYLAGVQQSGYSSGEVFVSQNSGLNQYQSGSSGVALAETEQSTSIESFEVESDSRVYSAPQQEVVVVPQTQYVQQPQYVIQGPAQVQNTEVVSSVLSSAEVSSVSGVPSVSGVSSNSINIQDSHVYSRPQQVVPQAQYYVEEPQYVYQAPVQVQRAGISSVSEVSSSEVSSISRGSSLSGVSSTDVSGVSSNSINIQGSQHFSTPQKIVAAPQVQYYDYIEEPQYVYQAPVQVQRAGVSSFSDVSSSEVSSISGGSSVSGVSSLSGVSGVSSNSINIQDSQLYSNPQKYVVVPQAQNYEYIESYDYVEPQFASAYVPLAVQSVGVSDISASSLEVSSGASSIVSHGSHHGHRIPVRSPDCGCRICSSGGRCGKK